MKKNIGYSFLVLGILVLCLSIGIYLGFRYTKNNENLMDYTETTAEDNNNENNDTTPVSTKNYDIEVVYEDKYNKCGHIIENKNMAYGTTLEKVKEEENVKQKENGNIYEIIEESNEKIIYSREIEQNCPNHFLVKLEDKTIVVYNVVDDSTMLVYKKINADLETLNPEMLEELNVGIKADSKEDLNLIIEDIES